MNGIAERSDANQSDRLKKGVDFIKTPNVLQQFGSLNSTQFTAASHGNIFHPNNLSAAKLQALFGLIKIQLRLWKPSENNERFPTETRFHLKSVADKQQQCFQSAVTPVHHQGATLKITDCR